MKIGFVGTSEFAADILAEIMSASEKHSWQISSVITKPDSPSGRGQKLTPSAVKKVVRESEAGAGQKIKLLQPTRLDADFLKEYSQHKPDILIVVAYGKILPQELLDLPPLGCFNIHTSLLPRWRGAAPVERAIEAGDKQTGISIFRIIAELDAGPVVLQKSYDIKETDTAKSVSAELLELAKQGILEFMAKPSEFQEQEQEAGVTYAEKLSKSEAELDWSQDAERLARKINAFNPRPGAFTTLDGQRLAILQAGAAAEGTDALPQDAKHGEFVFDKKAGKLWVKCGSGLVEILQVQFPGRQAMKVKQIQGSSALDKQKSFG